MTTLELADYIVHKVNKDHSKINNMYLNKLIYEIYDKLKKVNIHLFSEEDFETKLWGKCNLDVYYRYCGFAGMPIWIIGNREGYEIKNVFLKKFVDGAVEVFEEKSNKFFENLTKGENYE